MANAVDDFGACGVGEGGEYGGQRGIFLSGKEESATDEHVVGVHAAHIAQGIEIALGDLRCRVSSG